MAKPAKHAPIALALHEDDNLLEVVASCQGFEARQRVPIHVRKLSDEKQREAFTKAVDEAGRKLMKLIRNELAQRAAIARAASGRMEGKG